MSVAVDLWRAAERYGSPRQSALSLWRALEAWDPKAKRYRIDKGLPGAGRFMPGPGGGTSRPSLADVIRGTAAGGPKRQRADRGGMSIADAVRAAAQLSDTTGRPTRPSDDDRRQLAAMVGTATNRKVNGAGRLDVYESVPEGMLRHLSPRDRRAILADLHDIPRIRPERDGARAQAMLSRFAHVANDGDEAGGRALLDSMSEKLLLRIATDAGIDAPHMLPLDALKVSILTDPEGMRLAKSVPSAEIGPTAAAVQLLTPVRWEYGTQRITGRVPRGQRAAIEEALTEYATHAGVPGAEVDRRAEPPVNRALRSSSQLDERYQRHVAALDTVLDVSRLPEPVTVYRGITSHAFLGGGGSSLVGRTWSDPAYVSSTSNEVGAEVYAGSPGRGFAMRINLPAGFPAVAILDDEGGEDDEGEVLLPRGMTFRVTADNGIADGVHWVDVTVDAPEPAPAPAPRSSARRPVKTLSAGDLDGTAAALDAAASRDAAYRELGGMTMPQLRQIAERMGVALASKDIKQRALDRIVDSVVGRRLDSAAIDRMTRR